MQAPKRDQKALLLKSYRHIYLQIKQLLLTNNFAQLDQFLKSGDVLKRLSLGLLNFKSPQQGEASSRKLLMDQNNPKKWGDSLPLSSLICQALVLKLSQILNLDELLTFDLLDTYFLTDDKTQRQLAYLNTMVQNIEKINIDMQSNLAIGPQINTQQYLQGQMKLKERYGQEFTKTVMEVTQMAQDVYFDERRCLIDSIFLVFDAQLKYPKTNFASTLISNDLAENLIKSLEQNAQSFEVWSSMKNPRDVIVHLQREEISILKCLFQNYRHHQIPNAQQILRFLNYQFTNNFKGFVNKEKQMILPFQADGYIKAQQTIITDLSVLNSLNILQIHLFAEQDLIKSEQTKKFVNQLLQTPEQFKQLVQKLNELQLTHVSTPVYLAFRQVIKLIQKLDLLKTYQIGADKRQLIDIDFDRKNDEVQRMQFVDQIIQMNETHKYYEEEFHDKRGELNFLIQDWLNLIYPYLCEQNMVSEKSKSQALAFNILKQPIHLKSIWDQIERSNEKLIGAPLNLNRERKLRYHTLDIFEDIMRDPIDKIGDFSLIMTNLCGNKDHKYELKVMKLLKSYSGQDLERNPFGDKNMIQILLMKFENFTVNIERNHLSQLDFAQYINICFLLGKMISQNPLLYEELNNQFLQSVVEQEFVNEIIYKRRLRGKQNQQSYETNEPVLFLMIRALHSLFRWEIQDIVYAVKSILKAISKIYTNLNLQSEILMHIQFYQTSNNSYELVEFFKFAIDNYEFQNVITILFKQIQGRYKITEIVLKFLNSIFSKNFPQGFLEESQRVNIGNTIISKILTDVYQPLIQNYFQLNFSDVSDFAIFSYRVLKLTNILLKNYKDINPIIRAPISHKLPQFDYLLTIINEILNFTPVENIITQVLLLAEDQVEGVPTGLQNKFWISQLQKGKSDSRQTQHFQKMISTALKCYNTIMELSLINTQVQNLTQEKLGLIGTRTFYLTNLASVQNVSAFVQTPGQGPQYMVQRFQNTEISYSIYNIIQYYVKPSQSLSKQINEIHIQAVKFMLNCCNIWAIPSNRLHVNMESILRFTGVNQQEVRAQYIRNFIEASKQLSLPVSLQYLNVFFDLLIISASSQQSFLEDLLKDPIFKAQFIELIGSQLAEVRHNDIIECLVRDIKSKVVILLAEISTSRICTEFMKEITNQNNLKLIYQNIITKFIPDAKRNIDIDYQFNLSEDMAIKNQILKFNTKSTQDVYQVCQSLLTIKYYFRFLQDEYSRDVDNLHVREAITVLFQDQFLVSELHMMYGKTDEMYQEIQLVNMTLSQDINQRNEVLARQYESHVNLNHLVTQEQRIFMENSKLHLDDIYVFINQLDASSLQNYLSQYSNIPYLLQLNSFDTHQYAKLGPELMINTDELLDILRTYFYSDENFLSHVKIITSKYNMLLSYLFSYNQLTETIKNFILSIGKTRTRQNLRNKEFILRDRVLNTSLFVLAESKDPKNIIVNEEIVKGVQNRLSRSMINIAKTMIHQITSNYVQNTQANSQGLISQLDYPKIAFEVRQLETDLDYLTVVLGTINNLSTISVPSYDNLKQLEIVKSIIKALPNLRQQQLLSISQRDGGQALRTEYEQQAAKLYVNLVLQSFSILILIQRSQQDQQRQKDIMLIRDLQSDMEYIQIISTVVKLMQDKACFVEGLQILEISLNLLLNENLIMFFKRQESSPLRMIIQKLINPGTSTQECIKIVEFLINFTRVEQGAEILNQENLLHNISISSILSKVNKQEFYINDGESKRNPVHILWCFVLLFIRTLNSKLITDFGYRKTISSQLRLFEGRVIQVLDIGAMIKNSSDSLFIKTTLSLALFEELDLITGCLQQVMEYVDQLEPQDFKIYEQIKDRYLFSVIHLFAIDPKIKQGSATEQYLNGIIHEKMKENIGINMGGMDLNDTSVFTGFDLLVQVEKIRVFMNMNSSMVNLLLINQAQISGKELLNTWDRENYGQNPYSATPRQGDIDNISQSHSNYTLQTLNYPHSIIGLNVDTDFDEFLGLNYLTTAVYNYLQALNSMNKVFKFWRSNELSIADFYKDIYAYFNHDDWINNELMGLNTFLGGNTFKDIMEQFESAMQMGYLTAGLLLQNLVNLQKEKENAIGGRVTTSLKDLMDYGDNIKKLYADFFSEAKTSKFVKPSMESFGPIIQAVVESVKNSPQIDQRMY